MPWFRLVGSRSEWQGLLFGAVDKFYQLHVIFRSLRTRKV